MDPLTHWALGTSGALSVTKNDVQKHRYALVLAFASLGAVFPDIDALIQSAEDPLLYIEYHRHFTHSLILTPLYSLAIALLGYLFLRFFKMKSAPLSSLWRWTLFGMITHGFLDACTSYGTHLFWPLSADRSAWNIISIVDPLMTVPLLLLILLNLIKKNVWFSRFAVVWAFIYLMIGLNQRNGVLQFYQTYLDEQKFTPALRVDAKPSFANLWLWRGIAFDGSRYRVDAITKFPFSDVVINPGSSVFVKDLELALMPFDTHSRAMKDLERFRFFSDDYLYLYEMEGDKLSIGDLRYSLVPNSIDPLWIIQLNPNEQESPTPYKTVRDVTEEKKILFRRLLKGETLTVE